MNDDALADQDPHFVVFPGRVMTNDQVADFLAEEDSELITEDPPGGSPAASA